jgi:hypothetical protein
MGYIPKCHHPYGSHQSDHHERNLFEGAKSSRYRLLVDGWVLEQVARLWYHRSLEHVLVDPLARHVHEAVPAQATLCHISLWRAWPTAVC